jgi:putative peptidoglycan lipid II flippase
LPTSLNSTGPEVPVEDNANAHSDGVVRSAGIVSIAVFMSRITGLVRESLMAALFGAGTVMDAFNLGFRIPNLTRDLFAEGALSSAFVPTFTDYLTNRTKKEAAELANLVATALIIVVGSLCLLGVIFAPALVRLLASGWTANPEKFALAVRMTRIMFPFLLLVALAAQAMGILNACNQFGVPAMASTFFNIGSVAFGLIIGVALGPYIGVSRIEGMAIGVVCGGALQLMWQIPALRRSGFIFRPQLHWKHPGLVHILQLMGPAILGNAATLINVTVNTNFATQIHDPVRGMDGAVSWLNNAFRFMQLPLGIFGVAIASATLPVISRSASSGNMLEFRKTLSRSLGMVFLLTIPSSIGLAVLGQSIIGAIYQGGKFKLYDTQQTALALSCYAIGLAGYSALKVLSPSFYALGDARTPMTISLLSIGINLVVAWTFTHHTNLGHAGLALSTSVVALFGFTAQFLILRKRIDGIYGRNLATTVLKVTAASIAMGAIVWGSTHVMSGRFGTGRLGHLADLAVSIPLGLVVFYSVSRWLKVPDLDSAIKALSGPVLRRIRK